MGLQAKQMFYPLEENPMSSEDLFKQYSCEILDQPAQPVLSIRGRTSVQDLPRFLGETYDKIVQYLGRLGEAPAGPPFCGYFNMDMQNLEVEAGFPVARALPGEGEIQFCELPAGKAAVGQLIGPYTLLNQAYEALTQFVNFQGYEPTGEAYEFYLNDSQYVPPEELSTRIVFPLK